MEEPLEQERSVTNDDLKPSSSSSTTKSARSSKPTSNGSTRRHKRQRPTNSARSSSEHSSSSSRSSSSSSSHSSHHSIKPCPANEQEPKKSRSLLAQEHLQTIVEKTTTGHYDMVDGFAFLSFETDDDWRIAFEHFHQQQLRNTLTNKKSAYSSGKKNGHATEHSDGHALHRSISVPCKIEDGHRTHLTPGSAPADDLTNEHHRSRMWQNRSPMKNSADHHSGPTIKNEPMDKSSRTTSEHDDSHRDLDLSPNRTQGSSHKSNDDSRSENQERKHHHHHHHHKAHKRHKTKHDLTVNGDSSNKHPTITSMSDLAKQRIKSEAMSMPPSFHFPPHFDPKLFPLPSFSPFPSHHQPGPFPGSYDHSLMLANRFYNGQYPRDLPMPPPPPPPPHRPPSRSLPHPFSLRDVHPDSPASMEKMFEKFYPGVLPSYLAAAASAAAAASTNSNSPVSSLNMKMHGTSPHGPDHPLWSHREAFQRQYLAAAAASSKRSSTKSPLFDPDPKRASNHSCQSPNDRRHSSSSSNPDLPNSNTTPTGHPLYLAPVIVTEFHQHQHNHNHTHEHKLNITTKDERQSSSPRSKTPLSNEPKKPKSSFSVNDMFIDKPPPPPMKHSPQQQQQQGFLSVLNKRDTPAHANPSSLLPFKKSFAGKWSTAHVHIAWLIYHQEQRQRDKLNPLQPSSHVRATPGLLPPPLPLSDNTSDLGLFRPPPPSPFGLPFDINASQYPLFRPSSAMKVPRPTLAPTLSSPSIKAPTIKREQKTPFLDERTRRSSPPASLSRSTSGSNFLPSSPSQRMRMDFPPLLLPPPQHQLPNFSLNDDRKRFLPPNSEFLPPFGPSSGASPFLSSLFPMGGPPMSPIPPPMPSASSSLARRNGGLHSTGNSNSPKSSLFPPPFDFTRSPLLPPGLALGNTQFESDRYRFLLEQQARERDIQFAMMAAAANGGAPPPPMFNDPGSSALFKHY